MLNNNHSLYTIIAIYLPVLNVVPIEPCDVHVLPVLNVVPIEPCDVHVLPVLNVVPIESCDVHVKNKYKRRYPI